MECLSPSYAILLNYGVVVKVIFWHYYKIPRTEQPGQSLENLGIFQQGHLWRSAVSWVWGSLWFTILYFLHTCLLQVANLSTCTRQLGQPTHYKQDKQLVDKSVWLATLIASSGFYMMDSNTGQPKTITAFQQILDQLELCPLSRRSWSSGSLETYQLEQKYIILNLLK